MKRLLTTAAHVAVIGALAIPAFAQTPPPATTPPATTAPSQTPPASTPPPVLPQQQVAQPTTPLNPTPPTQPTAPNQAPILPGAIGEWRPLDLQNALVIDTTKGRIIIEMHPEAVPRHV